MGTNKGKGKAEAPAFKKAVKKAEVARKENAAWIAGYEEAAKKWARS
jgi:hypothetical protein